MGAHLQLLHKIDFIKKQKNAIFIQLKNLK